MNQLRLAIAALFISLLAPSVYGQITVLDSAQDIDPGEIEAAPSAPPPPCGTRPVSIARMSWPSAALLAEIHARVLSAEFGCETRIVSGDLAATVSSMGSTGQPSVAPELWINRIADLWNGAMEGQQMRSAAPSYSESQFEAWYMPASLADQFPEGPGAVDLAAFLPQVQAVGRIPFISCPSDWACSVINRNLVTAYGLSDILEVIEPTNRLDMDQMIAEAVSRREPFLFYYWQPNAILAQLDFVPLDMGEYDQDAAQCLAMRVCADPRPSSFPPDSVVIAIAERLVTDTPLIAAYFQRASLPISEMDRLLAQLNEGETNVEAIADRFVAERNDIWQSWVGGVP